MSNKKGVKKGSTQAVTYAKRRAAERDLESSNSKFGGCIETFDMMCVAIARMSPRYDEKWFARLNESLIEVRKEFRGLIETQAEFDRETGTAHDFSEAKVKVDRELYKAFGKNFAGWDVRWEPRRYSWGLPAFEPCYEKSCYWSAEDEEAAKKAAEWTLDVGARARHEQSR